VNDIPERIPGLEQAGALDHHQRTRTADHEPGGYADGFAFAARADQFQLGSGDESRFPRPDGAIGDPDDVREPRGGDVTDGSSGVEHGEIAESQFSIAD
jgi:hypothetical protein